LIAFMQASIFATMEHLPFLYLYLALIYSAVEASKDRTATLPVAPGPVSLPGRAGRMVHLRRPGRRA
jgi:hypothetical protein